MSFKSLEKTVVNVSQKFMGEDCTLKQGATEKLIKGIFDADWIESNGTSTYQQMVRIKEADLIQPVGKSDTVKRGNKTYKVQVCQQDGPESLLLILVE